MRSLLAACRARWKRLSSLARDVTLIMILKASALALLWSLFFSAPVARHMSVAPEQVAAQFVSPATPPERADALR